MALEVRRYNQQAPLPGDRAFKLGKTYVNGVVRPDSFHAKPPQLLFNTQDVFYGKNNIHEGHAIVLEDTTQGTTETFGGLSARIFPTIHSIRGDRAFFNPDGSQAHISATTLKINLVQLGKDLQLNIDDTTPAVEVEALVIDQSMRRQHHATKLAKDLASLLAEKGFKPGQHVVVFGYVPSGEAAQAFAKQFDMHHLENVKTNQNRPFVEDTAGVYATVYTIPQL